MKVLVVGGTGLIGSVTAGHLAAQGREVTLAARHRPEPESAAARFPVLVGDYVDGSLGARELAGFDAVVFAAGNDIRHLPPGADEDAFWARTQAEGVPRFIARARAAGVGRVVQLGSYYHQVMPELTESNAYVQARALADERSRALATPSCAVMTLNPPSIVGIGPGASARRYRTLVAWARGERPEIPFAAPPGGTNYMSVRSLAEAVDGALTRGESGRAYLIGDENLGFGAFFQLFLDAVGNPARIDVRDEPSALLPDAFIVPGRGVTLAYEPDPADSARLGYRRGDVRRAVHEIVARLGETRPDEARLGEARLGGS